MYALQNGSNTAQVLQHRYYYKKGGFLKKPSFIVYTYRNTFS